MKIIITILICFLLFLGATPPYDGVIYYVDAVNGNDSMSGTRPWGAFKTLDKINALTIAPNTSIRFKRGQTWRGTVTASYDGTSGNEITYEAYGSGDNPIISGAEIITGWSVYSGSIYQATVSSAVNQLFKDDSRVQEARYPNTGYFDVTEVINATTIVSTDLSTSINYAGAKLIIRSNTWTIESIEITSSSNDTLYLASTPTNTIDVGEGLFLTGKIEFISTGQWVYLSSTGKVYYRTAASDNPSIYTIEGSVYERGFSVVSDDYITIKNLTIKNQSDYCIHAYQSDYLTVENCELLYPDKLGINVEGNSGDNTYYNIVDNYIDGANHYGAKITADNTTMSGNEVYNIALLDSLGGSGMGDVHTAGMGLRLDGDNNLIEHNKVENTGYSGISWVGLGTVQYNFVKNACLAKGDGGGIYTGGGNAANPTNTGSIVQYNIVDGVRDTLIGTIGGTLYGYGIYMDNYSGNLTINNNTVKNCSRAGVFLHINKNIEVKENTIYDFFYGVNIGLDTGDGNNVHDNIIYGLDGQILIGNQLTDYVHSWNNNTYIQHYNTDSLFLETDSWTPPSSDYLTFTEWQALGNDLLSTIDATSITSDTLVYNATTITKTVDLTGWYSVGGVALGSEEINPYEGIIATK